MTRLGMKKKPSINVEKSRPSFDINFPLVWPLPRGGTRGGKGAGDGTPRGRPGRHREEKSRRADAYFVAVPRSSGRPQLPIDTIGNVVENHRLGIAPRP